MKDRVYMVLAFMGFIILCIVYVFNSASSSKLNQTYQLDSFYVPKDQAYNNDNAANLIYQEMIGSRSMTCPKTELDRASAVLPNSIPSGSERSTYGVVCLPVNGYVTGTTSAITKTEDLDSISGINSVGPVTLSSLGATASSTYYELIAPFSFEYGNKNVDVSEDGLDEIILVSSTGNCRIIFKGIQNWFCAGVIGTVTQSGSGTYQNEQPWSSHDTCHLSVIGKSSNALLKKGGAGYIVGYGTTNTTIEVQKLTEDGYVTISLKEFVSSVTTN